jgi:methionyl aminopeptidase
MTVGSAQELAQLQHIGGIVARSLQTLRTVVQPGITTAGVDAIAGDLLAGAGAKSAPWITCRFSGNISIL